MTSTMHHVVSISFPIYMHLPIQDMSVYLKTEFAKDVLQGT